MLPGINFNLAIVSGLTLRPINLVLILVIISLLSLHPVNLILIFAIVSSLYLKSFIFSIVVCECFFP